MPISFKCECGKIFNVPTSAAGSSGKCSACGRRMIVPVPDNHEAEKVEAVTRLETSKAKPRITRRDLSIIGLVVLAILSLTYLFTLQTPKTEIPVVQSNTVRGITAPVTSDQTRGDQKEKTVAANLPRITITDMTGPYAKSTVHDWPPGTFMTFPNDLDHPRVVILYSPTGYVTLSQQSDGLTVLDEYYIAAAESKRHRLLNAELKRHSFSKSEGKTPALLVRFLDLDPGQNIEMQRVEVVMPGTGRILGRLFTYRQFLYEIDGSPVKSLTIKKSNERSETFTDRMWGPVPLDKIADEIIDPLIGNVGVIYSDEFSIRTKISSESWLRFRDAIAAPESETAKIYWDRYDKQEWIRFLYSGTPVIVVNIDESKGKDIVGLLKIGNKAVNVEWTNTAYIRKFTDKVYELKYLDMAKEEASARKINP